MVSGYDELAVRGIYYTTIMRDTNNMNAAFASKAKQINPKNTAIIDLNQLIIKSFLASNTNMMIHTFREDLQALGKVVDPKAASASPLGRQLFSYCSDYWADARKRCEDTFAEIAPAQ